LRELGEAVPVVMETHGGWGKLYLRCYRHIESGIVFEQNSDKSAALAKQRPTWSVYEADCERAIRAGAGSHLSVNFLDLDPYGEPWPVLDAFLESDRPRADRLVLVVNDGLRQKLKLNAGWQVKSHRDVVDRRGNTSLYRDYLDICREMVTEKAAKAGYDLRRWVINSITADLTHYAAVLER